MTTPRPESFPVAAEELSVRYRRRRPPALDRVSFQVPEGSVYALLGRNGAGKSSLIRCLLGEQRPDAGRALLLGRDAWRHRVSILSDVGVVPEDSNAPPSATARQLAAFCAKLYPRWDGASVSERLGRFGVPPDVAYSNLSKGQRGQVALALALASLPRLLVLDDPTLGLDAVARHALFEELIGELADRGTTVLIATHELAAVEGIADRVGILAGGRVLLDEELERLKHRFRRISLPLAGDGWEAALHGLSPLQTSRRPWGTETVVAAYDDSSLGPLRGHFDSGEVGVSALNLEEIFVALVGGAQEVTT